MKIVYANSNTSIGGPNGGVHRLVKGEPWDANDPLVKHRPEFFSDQPTRIKTSTRGWSEVEQMTAAPGEKRRR
jgi:hypothetical protein